MGKSSHFSGQPLYGQVIKLLDKSKILQFSSERGGERYTKRFSSWVHLVVMLYAVILRHDSLREITTSLMAEARKLAHLGVNIRIGRSTLADANKRRPEAIFEAIYRDLYATYRQVLSSDSNYYIGNFYIKADYSWTSKYFPDIYKMDKISRPVPNDYHIHAGWGNGKVNASVTLGNFFRRSWKNEESWVLSPVYRRSDISYGIGRRQLLTFSLSYSFDYGKKIQRGDEISGDVEGATSTILR